MAKKKTASLLGDIAARNKKVEVVEVKEEEKKEEPKPETPPAEGSSQ